MGYINSCQPQIQTAWISWFGDGSQLGYNLASFSSNFPRVGLAISGGGYRAALYGAGVFSALDARNSSSVSSDTGGLLQVSSYLSGLSGGSWLVASLVFNDFPTIPEKIRLQSNQYYFGSILSGIMDKAYRGFITDPWARALSYHFFNGTNIENFFTNSSSHGAGYLWSQIPQSPSFQSSAFPYPLLVADSRPSNFDVTGDTDPRMPPNATVYEISPYELGSWDPALSTFAELPFIGTQLVNGLPTNVSNCVSGFDEAGFVIGTSASLFNALLYDDKSKLLGFSKFDALGLLDLLRRILDQVSTSAKDVANWPNPFRGLNPSTFADSAAEQLELIDGGSNAENIPLSPLLLKTRALDVIVAVDGGSDNDNNFPEGVALYATFNRTQEILSDVSQAFPPVPSNPADFVNFNLNQWPTFFGCDPLQNPPEWPLLIYLPNTPPLDESDPLTNSDVFLTEYSTNFVTLFLDASHLLTTSGFTPGSTSPDPNFGKCLQCAAIDRARLKLASPIPRSDLCAQCFSKYCFNPNSTTPPGKVVGRSVKFVSPDGDTGIKGFLEKEKIPLIIGLSVLDLLIAGLVAFCCIRRGRRVRRQVYSRIQGHDADAWRSSIELSRR